MKGLLNVLYRRILYKIPLKFLLLLLAIFWLLFASCNAWEINLISKDYKDWQITYWKLRPSPLQVYTWFIIQWNITDYKCSLTWEWEYCYQSISFYSNWQLKYCYLRYQNWSFTYQWNCSSSMDKQEINIWDCKNWRYNTNRCFDYLTLNFDYNLLCETCPTCTPQYTSEECQTEYWLVESWVLTSCQTDLNSCIINTSWFNDLLNNCNNNLNACNLSLSSCLQSNCPTTSWDISWSSLFINDIQHIWWPSIYIWIPEEIGRDYSYVDDDMYITVDWYNVDYDKINWIINTQNYKPSTEDFNYIISSVIPLFVPWLVIILFLYWIFKFIKKIF